MLASLHADQWLPRALLGTVDPSAFPAMPFIHKGRARYAETDAMGVVHHASYVPWLEEARVAMLRSVGHSYRDLEANGTFLPVIAINLRYVSPLRFDDEYMVEVVASAEGRTKVVFASRILAHDGRICVEGSVTVACVDRQGRPGRVPAEILAALQVQVTPTTHL
jgi:acyl-CoA thioester hydrolase